MKIYNISKGQLYTIIVFGVVVWIGDFFYVVDSYLPSGFSIFMLALIPAILIFYAIGWKKENSKNLISDKLTKNIQKVATARKNKYTINADKNKAKSNFLPIWPGYILGALFILVEIVEVVAEELSGVSSEYYFASMFVFLAGWIYYLFVVSRMHLVIAETTEKKYPIKSDEVAWKHFIPFYNIYWILKWPLAITSFLKFNGVKIMNGWVIGILTLFVIFLRVIDGGISLIALFIVLSYIAKRSRAAITEETRKAEPEQARDTSLWKR